MRVQFIAGEAGAQQSGVCMGVEENVDNNWLDR